MLFMIVRLQLILVGMFWILYFALLTWKFWHAMFCLPSLLVVTTSQFLLKLAGNLLVARTHWHGNLSVTCRSKSLIMPYNNRLLCYIHGWLLHYNTSNFILIWLICWKMLRSFLGCWFLGHYGSYILLLADLASNPIVAVSKFGGLVIVDWLFWRPVKAVELQCIGRWRHASNVSLQRPNAHIGSSLWELVRKNALMPSCYTLRCTNLSKTMCAPNCARLWWSKLMENFCHDHWQKRFGWDTYNNKLVGKVHALHLMPWKKYAAKTHHCHPLHLSMMMLLLNRPKKSEHGRNNLGQFDLMNCFLSASPSLSYVMPRPQWTWGAVTSPYDHCPMQVVVTKSEAGQLCLLGLVNLAFVTGHLPVMWKIVPVIPIRKPGKIAGDIAGHRPISLMAAVFKLLDKMLYRRIWPAIVSATSPWQGGGTIGADAMAWMVSQVLPHRRETCAHDLTLAAFVDGQSAFCRPPACVVTEALLKIPGVGDYNIRAINAVLSDLHGTALLDSKRFFRMALLCGWYSWHTLMT